MNRALTYPRIVTRQQIEADMFDYRKDLDKYDAPHLRRMNQAPDYLGALIKYLNMFFVALFWGVLIGSMGLVALWMIAFAVSFLGML